ncbi:MAG: formate--tetrahydrofolate ligase [Gemmatimonadetes bacterium]|nr:formate--tetrahydrofolate ligase [Gemmatimonadota bacterium]MYG36393.1 formate--tetrahydrofolate ligase [Gemmatimonadota bacterium]
MRSDIEIAQAHEMKPIAGIAAKVGLGEDEILQFGHYKAKVPLDVVQARPDRGARLVLVTGCSPTAAGEGKTTTSVGLADALNVRERNPVLCIREASLGPVFGIKGGAAGGGYSQVVPMEDINLHFTGDFHAITSAHSLLSAMLDNHLFRPNSTGLDHRRITWGRAVDMNDRALRNVIVGLGGPFGGIPREDGFMITAASEVMAIFCLARDLADLEQRLGNIIIGYTRSRDPVRCRDIGAHRAMTILMRDALHPNLVQTLGGTPTFIHGGPFANIAHGCNSLIATRAGLKLGDIVVTEAGFGADLGAEKFFDIKCRLGGLSPDAVAIVATIRALKMNGGASKDSLATEDVEALGRGLENLYGHVENVAKFGVPAVVALNRFASDTPAEVAAVLDGCAARGIRAVEADPHGGGGAGCVDLADAVWEIANSGDADFRPLYPDKMPLREKIETVATEIYGASGVDFAPAVPGELERLESFGLANAPVCIAKTQYSFSDNPALLGRPRGFRITVREVTPSAGAGFVVVKTGSIMTMPGLAARPASLNMTIDEDGVISGLM